MNILAELKSERDKLTKAINALEGKVAHKKAHKRMSKAARKRISLAQKKRWAKKGGKK